MSECYGWNRLLSDGLLFFSLFLASVGCGRVLVVFFSAFISHAALNIVPSYTNYANSFEYARFRFNRKFIQSRSHMNMSPI